MADRICSVADCTGKVLARGWCSKHYQRWKHHGTTDSLMRERGTDPPACSIADCTRPGTGPGGLGWCNTHYRRYQRHGSPFVTSRIVGDDAARFETYLTPGGPPAHAPELGPCWLCRGLLTGDGYGVMLVQDLPTASAHSWSYRHHVGPLLDELELDHVCRVRNCVNPYHLDPVPQAINKQRAAAAKRSADLAA